MRQLLSVLLLVLVAPVQGFGFFSVAETGEVIPEGNYRAYLAPQILMGDGGLNFVGHFDAGLSDSSSARMSLGVGTTDFHASGYYKWVPFPDYGNQPAIGFRGGVTLGRDGDQTITALRFYPIVSKVYHRPEGTVIPYISSPLGISKIGDDTQLPIQVVIGSEWRPEQLRYVRFGAEIGVEVHEAFSFLTIYSSIDIDAARGLVFE